MPASVDRDTFAQQVLAAPQPTLVHFWAPWCGLCRSIAPVLESIQTEWRHALKIVDVNADENLQLANAYKLSCLPTLVLFHRGRAVRRLEGLQHRDRVYQEVTRMAAEFAGGSPQS